MSLFRTKIYFDFICIQCISKDNSSASGAFVEWKCFVKSWELSYIKLYFYWLSCVFVPWGPSWAKQLQPCMLPSKSWRTCCSSSFPIGAQHPDFLIRCTREGTHKRIMLALLKEKAPYKKSIHKLSPKHTLTKVSVNWVMTL